MKKYIGAFLLLLSLAANAEPKAIPPGGSLSCPEGCLVLSPKDVAELEQAVNHFARQAAQAAFQAGGEQGYKEGMEEALEVLKNNPKLCPKNT